MVSATLLFGLSSLLAVPIIAFLWFRDYSEPARFVLHLPEGAHLWSPGVIPALMSNLGPGGQIAASGFALVAIFMLLLLWGRATLPLRLRHAGSAVPLEYDRQVVLFGWIMICLLPVERILEGLLALPLFLAPDMWAGHLPLWVTSLGKIVGALLLLLLVLIASGHDWRNTLQKSFHRPPIAYLGLGAGIPAVLAILCPLFWLAHDRILWSAHHWGNRPAPLPATYFAIPAAASLWYFPPALVEEVA
ncbi:MAG TPA: hypothetical protein VEG64_08500 [Candidatus Sulfotelmatobacter sp.]|nr:hypothetical protein [Candidatus Sulfotelmatobacter sp.]